MSYFFPGTKVDFAREFGGLPQRGIGLVNIFLIAVIIITIIIIILIITISFLRPEDIYLDHEGFFNLDKLIDLNRSDVECCVFAGQTAPNESYVYDTLTGITYSRQKPANIQTTCNTFPDPTACVSTNTDSDGNIIPTATFKAQPYYTFESGLFIQCASTTSCI